MPSYDHEELIERNANLDILPKHAAKYAIWIRAGGHKSLLRDNASDDVLVLCKGRRHTVAKADCCLPSDFERTTIDVINREPTIC